MTEPPISLSPSQVSLILQRAAEIDARGESVTVEELKRIAAEAGIDAMATTTAIQEVLAEEDSEPPPPAKPEGKPPAKRSLVPSPWRIAVGGALGTAFGLILPSSEFGPLSVVALLLYILLRVVQSMKRGTELDYQLQNFALWFGVLMGTASTDIGSGDMAMAVFFGWFLTSVIGGLLVRFGPRTSDEPERSG